MTVVGRWERRIFGATFGAAEEHLAALSTERVEETDELDLVSLRSDASVKGRGGLSWVVPVHKRRERHTLGDCMAEVTELRTEAAATRSRRGRVGGRGARDRRRARPGPG